MLKWAIFFAIVALVAGMFGFTGIAAGAAGIAKILFVVFLGMFTKERGEAPWPSSRPSPMGCATPAPEVSGHITRRPSGSSPRATVPRRSTPRRSVASATTRGSSRSS
jgi:uncharacterized membrane protein YtjA (UPF0391 family)